MGLDGKVCIMTGGGSGIGRAAAIKMSEQGAKVVLVGRTASKVEAVREEVSRLAVKRPRSALMSQITMGCAIWSSTLSIPMGALISW